MSLVDYPVSEYPSVEELLPMRKPALLLTGVLQCDEEFFLGEVQIPLEPWWLDSHFPNYSIQPGVLTIEMGAQGLAYMVLYAMSKGDRLKYLPVLLENNNCRFLQPIFPGMNLLVEVTKLPTDRRSTRAGAFRIFDAQSESRLMAEGQVTGLVIERSRCFPKPNR